MSVWTSSISFLVHNKEQQLIFFSFEIICLWWPIIQLLQNMLRRELVLMGILCIFSENIYWIKRFQKLFKAKYSLTVQWFWKTLWKTWFWIADLLMNISPITSQALMCTDCEALWSEGCDVVNQLFQLFKSKICVRRADTCSAHPHKALTSVASVVPCKELGWQGGMPPTWTLADKESCLPTWTLADKEGCLQHGHGQQLSKVGSRVQ